MGEIIHLYRGGELDSAQNRDFVRAFADRVLSPADRGNFIDSEGAISANGIRRMQAALVARAYGDEALVTALFESADNDIRAIGGALLDASGVWAQMRQEARDYLRAVAKILAEHGYSAPEGQEGAPASARLGR